MLNNWRQFHTTAELPVGFNCIPAKCTGKCWAEVCWTLYNLPTNKPELICNMQPASYTLPVNSGQTTKGKRSTNRSFGSEQPASQKPSSHTESLQQNPDQPPPGKNTISVRDPHQLGLEATEKPPQAETKQKSCGKKLGLEFSPAPHHLKEPSPNRHAASRKTRPPPQAAHASAGSILGIAKNKKDPKIMKEIRRKEGI